MWTKEMVQSKSFLRTFSSLWRMKLRVGAKASTLLGNVWSFICKCLLLVLSFGPIPKHIAFIMDGNRRFAKRAGMKVSDGHRAGFGTLVTAIQYCLDLHVKYVTVYAFSIDNFKRKPEEVEHLLSLMVEKIYELLKEDSVVMRNQVRMNCFGDLSLLTEPARLAAEEAMARTASHTGLVLSVCVAYTSSDEIMHAVRKSCTEKRDVGGLVSVADLEESMYLADCADPDVVIRTSGESRLSNFLLWQTASSLLQILVPLWPELSASHLVWALLEYQKVYPYLKEIRSRIKKKQ